jgi:hypothetical protein
LNKLLKQFKWNKTNFTIYIQPEYAPFVIDNSDYIKIKDISIIYDEV